ncbi:peptide chain release factor 1 [Rubrivirga sp. SAORIC476]|uniref:peptide chain release factor 1 n=1 Tax=Rubrivirga sp. SAORIC476 TaxID=1961794 RepID=UPI000BA969E7|nr:peptide chain release factor 1 [Rubrivirga sp. SAORIC476]MBC14767.1 peptide chain release factor 1 [Rhodothermaceae bacterium]PAP80323.1 peptide chain release factor 1 [Rubrivirga sp. SAORIC476]
MINPDALDALLARYQEVLTAMSQPDVASDPSQLASLGREMSGLEPAVKAARLWRELDEEVKGLREMVEAEEGEMAELAAMELEEVEERLAAAEKELEEELVPKDPEDARDAIVEIRSGTGGDEAALFAGDLFDMYQKVAADKGWKVEVMDTSEGTAGGFRDITFALKGKDVFGRMKYESGVHRVQRVPATESQGRIHTSAATVAVLPEAEEVDVEIRAQDVRIDVYRSSGPGGQSVNTTDSAVRLTHEPTGLVVSIQDEKSQIKNKEKAFRVLRSRLYQLELDRVHNERAAARKEMVGSGDRSGKIRTYNWPQGRVTDHRLEGDDKNHALQNVLDGDLDAIVRALALADREARMEEAANG